jgi:dextranase
MMQLRKTQFGYRSGGFGRTPIRALLVLLVTVIACPGGAAHAISIARVNNDKSRYDPAEQVVFNLTLQGTVTGSQEVRVTYRHLSDVVETVTVPVTSRSLAWAWTPPTTDYRGYTVEMEVVENSVVTDRSSIAVDVSSDWARFPRYGFLSKFPNLTSAGMDAVIDNLNRYHINGLQFYDWSDKHHDPLAGTGANPDATWQDIANRTNTLSAVSGYIQRAHDKNMVAMSYNLLYGTLDDAASDGVQASWTLHTNPSATNPDVHDLPDGWKSDLYLVDPSNTGWQQYIADKTAEAFVALPFDGWHIDQLGNRGTRYDSNGTPVNLAATFGPFVDNMSAWLNKRMVFNAVNQYGQSGIADADVDFLYSEVWDPFNHYNDLANIILANNAHGNGQLNTVLAAYVNYNLTDSPGTFNAPSVLLADAVIFAFGGAHLELGEHMLRHEYFPIDNLLMTTDLREQLTGYYDFLVGYENLLRDGGDFGGNPMSSSNADTSMWPAQQGDISIINKMVDGREVFHLINFIDAAHMDWRDADGVQPEPSLITGMDLSFVSASQIAKLWAASPDDGGLPFELSFTQDETGLVSFSLPSLKYWSMIVAEPFVNIAGDVNGDGFVGIEDLNVILSNWNLAVPVGDQSQGDLAGIGDGFVGIEDLNVVLSNWNAGTPPGNGPAVPEPVGLMLWSVICVGALHRRPRV